MFGKAAEKLDQQNVVIFLEDALISYQTIPTPDNCSKREGWFLTGSLTIPGGVSYNAFSDVITIESRTLKGYIDRGTYSACDTNGFRIVRSDRQRTQDTADRLIYAIEQWGIDRNITEQGGATVSKQVSKLTEELAECIEALGDKSSGAAGADEDLKDAFGDMMVCIIQAARLAGFTTQECLQKAYDEIKNRKGTMVNGKFIKEA